MSCLPAYKDMRAMSHDEAEKWHKEVYRPHVAEQKANRRAFAAKYYKRKKK